MSADTLTLVIYFSSFYNSFCSHDIHVTQINTYNDCYIAVMLSVVSTVCVVYTRLGGNRGVEALSASLK